MTDDKVRQAVEALCALLLTAFAGDPIDARRMDADEDHHDKKSRAEHLLFMCTRFSTFLEAGQREKAMRWLGFIQGAIWADRVATIEQMKRMNTSDEVVTSAGEFPLLQRDGLPNIEGLDTLLRRAPLNCPSCGKRHVDEGEWATRRHHTHRCVDDAAGRGCGHEWRLEEYVFGARL